MRIGFTGTQTGMTAAQKWQLGELLAGAAIELHHGDCVGADCEAHTIALAHGRRIVIHPPDNPTKRAWCQQASFIMDGKPYLKRNRNIIEATNRLIAAPKSKAEELRSGTWSTVRFARKLRRPILILFPDGTWSTENIS